MKNKFFCVMGLIFILPVFSVSAQIGGSEIGMPSALNEADLKNLIDNPVVISALAKELPDDKDGKEWFTLACDTHILTLIPIEKIYAALKDFASYPKNFGAKEAKIIRTQGNGDVVSTSAGKFGVNSTYVYLQSEPVNSDAEHLIVRISIDTEGDQTIKNMDTQYYMKTLTLDGKTYTYLRNSDTTDYLGGRLPFQFTVMKGGNESSHKDGLKDLVKAAAKY
ncbi:MAG: hypothetical protein LBV68_05470 [Spirochaetaceae bacterium]|nr:hypothetical protein [Spirochaetaceae bacterium]